MIKSINLAWIVVADLDSAIDYYTNVVGLVLEKKNEMFGWAELVGSEGGARLGIAQAQSEEMKPGSNAIVTFTVEDIEEAMDEMKGQGAMMLGEVMEVPGHCLLQLIADPDGNQIQLHQSLEKATV